MARDYGKLFTRAWGDPDFRALNAEAQRLYMALVSQPDTSMAGVLTTAPARWAGQVAGGTVESIEAALADLEAARFTITDRVTMETLVRSFVRHDMGWKSPKTMIGIDSSIRAVLSPSIKAAIAAELARCDTSTLSAVVNDKTGRSTRDVVTGIIAALRHDFPHTPCDGVSDTPSHTPSDGVSHGVSQLSLTETEPEPEPEPEPETENEPETEPEPSGRDHLARFETEFWPPYPRKTAKGAARTAWVKAVGRADPDVILDAVHRYAADPNLPADQTKIPHASTWLNQDRWEDGPQPASADHLTRGDMLMRREAQAAMPDYWHSAIAGQPTYAEIES